MTARDAESDLLGKCCAAARQGEQEPLDQREANVFRLAAMVIQSRFPNESMHLMRASVEYFASRPDERLAAAEVIRKGWILSLPR